MFGQAKFLDNTMGEKETFPMYTIHNCCILGYSLDKLLMKLRLDNIHEYFNPSQNKL